MGGASSFYSMLAIAGFLAAIWVAGQLSRLLRVSSIVLEVGTGLVLGPGVAGLIPKELSECYDYRSIKCEQRQHKERIAIQGYKYCDLQAYLEAGKYVPAGAKLSSGFWGKQARFKHDGILWYWNAPDRRLAESVNATFDGLTEETTDQRRLASGNRGKAEFDSYEICLEESCELDLALRCASTPDIFSLVGHTGVAMMIFESGMHFDFDQARTVGPWACAVAILGTFLPIIFGAGLTKLLDPEFPWFPDALSAGVALAPTSVGIALKLLHEAKALQTYFGQAVMTAAFVDDVLSLVLFSVLFSLGGDMTFLSFLPLILGCIFMVLAIIAAVKVWPPVIKFLFDKIPETKANAKLTRHDEIMWMLMFLVLVVYALITHLCGTHLWGCFIAGMSFATLHHAHHVWVRQVKRITCWFIRIFFACTLAWSIPIDELFSLDAFWKGSIMGIVACIGTKVCCAPFMGKARWVIGWAMVGRAEFAYFIAVMANSVRMMHDRLFAILIWGLIYATIFAPLVFRKVLHRYMVSEGLAEAKDESADACRVSGHLPDLEQEENEEKERKMHTEYDEMKLQLDERDNEIKRLSLQANAVVPPDMVDELKSRNQEIDRLKASLQEAENSLKESKLREEALARTAALPVVDYKMHPGSTKLSL